MLKIILLSAMLILTPALNAGQDIIETVFRKYANTEGVTSVQLSGNLLRMLAEMDNSDQELNKLASSITSVNILHAPKELSASRSLDFYSEIVPGLRTENYNEIMRIQQPGQKVLIIADETGGAINELILIAGGGGDNTLICIRGKLDMNNIASLSGIDVPGLDELVNLMK